MTERNESVSGQILRYRNMVDKIVENVKKSDQPIVEMCEKCMKEKCECSAPASPGKMYMKKEAGSKIGATVGRAIESSVKQEVSDLIYSIVSPAIDKAIGFVQEKYPGIPAEVIRNMFEEILDDTIID